VVRSDRNEWTVEPGEVEDPDVLVTATKDAWARFLASDTSLRSRLQSGIDIAGARSAVRTFLKALEVFPFGRHQGDLIPSTSSRRMIS
jgi:hypothetical protein